VSKAMHKAIRNLRDLTGWIPEGNSKDTDYLEHKYQGNKDIGESPPKTRQAL
jgi:hypothetical protein